MLTSALTGPAPFGLVRLCWFVVFMGILGAHRKKRNPDLLVEAGEGTEAIKIVNKFILKAIQLRANSIHIIDKTVFIESDQFLEIDPVYSDSVFRRLCIMTDTLPNCFFEGAKTGHFEVLVTNQRIEFDCSYHYRDRKFYLSLKYN